MAFLRRCAAAVTLVATILVPTAVARADAPDDLASWNAKSLGFASNAVAYDTSRAKVLATVPGTNKALGNELVELDPNTGTISRHVFVGSEPNAIAITDDHSTAYVGLGGTPSIAQIDLVTFSLARTFATLAPADFGRTYVEDIATVPGHPDMVVASLKYLNLYPDHAGLWAWKDGAVLPHHSPDLTISNRVEVASGTTAYAYNTQTTEYGLRTFAIDSDGITQVSSGQSAISGGFDIEYAGGLVYSTTGVAVDPVTRATVHSYAAYGQLEVTPGNNRVTFVDGTTVKVFNLSSGASVASRSMAISPATTSLVATGTGFALSSPDGTYLIGPSVGGGAVTLPTPPPSSIAGLVATAIPSLQANDIAFDATHGVLYASVSSSSATHPDEVVAVDPVTGVIVNSLYLGSDPSQLAVSSDGSRLYVGLNTTGQIARIDTATFQSLSTFSLGVSPFAGPLRASDIQAMPGAPGTIAVALAQNLSPSFAGDVVYDDGVARPDRVEGFTGGNQLAFTDASSLYGTETDSTGFSFQSMTVDATGVHLAKSTFSLIDSFGARIEQAAGLIYATTGQVIQPSGPAELGRYPASGAVEPNVAAGRAYVAVYDGTLREYDLTKFRLIDSRSLLPATNPTSLVRTSVGFGSLNWSGFITLLRDLTIPAISSISPSGGLTAGGMDVTITGSNLSGATAVSFGGTPASSFHAVNPNQLVATTPPHSAGTVPVVVNTPAGVAAGAGATFSYFGPRPFVPITPARVLETRASQGQIGYSGPKPGAGAIVVVPVAGVGGVPSTGVGAVAINVTATQTTAPGYVTVWPCGTPQPPTSTLNADHTDQTVANGAILGLGPSGSLCAYIQSGTHLIIDVTGWLPAGTGFTSLAPARLLETRPSIGQVGYSGPKPGAGSVVELQVTGRGGVPVSGVAAVALNLTATEASGPGWVTAWPCGTAKPPTSSLNLNYPGQTVANMVVAGLGADGKLCLFVQTGTHLIADVTGWFSGSQTVPISPARLLETRASQGQVGYFGSKPAAGQVVQFQVTGVGGIPSSSVVAVAVNLTATEATGAGYITVWPCGTSKPPTSTLNVEAAGQTVANAAIVGVGAGGKLCVFTQAGTHLVADVTTYYTD